MKTILFDLGAKRMHLFYNGEAMFALDALDEGIEDGAPDWWQRAMQNTLDGKRLLCKVACVLAEQGELCRRYLGYDPERVPTEAELNLLLTPMLHVKLRSAVALAVDEGLGSPSSDEDDDIDVGLAELEKKTIKSRSRAI